MRSASSVPMVVLPDPVTPINTTIIRTPSPSQPKHSPTQCPIALDPIETTIQALSHANRSSGTVLLAEEHRPDVPFEEVGRHILRHHVFIFFECLQVFVAHL